MTDLVFYGINLRELTFRILITAFPRLYMCLWTIRSVRTEILSTRFRFLKININIELLKLLS